jgi:DNA-directed RNA polymerase subunit omega
MAKLYDTMMSPEVELLMDKVGSKFGLCTLASTRAREINAYFGQLGEGLGAKVPPQVTSVARKPLSIAFEEIAAEKIVPIRVEDVVPVEDPADEAGEAAVSGDTA